MVCTRVFALLIRCGPMTVGRREELRRIIRRRRRVLLVGQPGSGKSVATLEIAAACAGQRDAPVPVLVQLPDLLPVVRDRDLRLADVIEVGYAGGPSNHGRCSRRHLTEAAVRW